MKALGALVLAFGLFTSGLLAQETKTNSPAKIPANAAKDHIGEQKTVTGKIVEVNRAEKLVRLNLDQPFPRQTFTIVIFASQTNQFQDLDALQGKTIEVSGKITEYRQRPQMVLTSTNQIRIIQSSSAPDRVERR